MNSYYANEVVNPNSYVGEALGIIITMKKIIEIIKKRQKHGATLHNDNESLINTINDKNSSRNLLIIFHFNALDECSSSANTACWPISGHFCRNVPMTLRNSSDGKVKLN